MSDENPTPAPAEAPTPAPPAQEDTDWKAEARKWEQRAKENKDAAARLSQIEEAQKTESQKQADALAKANAELAVYKRREQVSKWADEITKEDEFKGIPASALRGDTEEDLRAHAAELKALIKPSGPAVPSQGKHPAEVESDPMREFTKNIFASTANE